MADYKASIMRGLDIGSCRLLATIDAARVNTVSSGNGIAPTPDPLPWFTCPPDCPHSHEADGSHYDVRKPVPGYAQPTPDPLREAAQTFLDAWDMDRGEVDWSWIDDRIAALRAALGEEPTRG